MPIRTCEQGQNFPFGIGCTPVPTTQQAIGLPPLISLSISAQTCPNIRQKMIEGEKTLIIIPLVDFAEK
jgi:hypothetical protein